MSFNNTVAPRSASNNQRKRTGYQRLQAAAFFSAVFFLSLLLPRVASAINFGVLNSGACLQLSGLDAGGFCQDIGIDYNPLFDNLVTSVHYNTNGNPNAFDYVNRFTGARTPIGNPVINNVADERKVTVVRQVQGACSQQWPVGTIFSGTG